MYINRKQVSEEKLKLGVDAAIPNDTFREAPNALHDDRDSSISVIFINKSNIHSQAQHTLEVKSLSLHHSHTHTHILWQLFFLIECLTLIGDIDIKISP